MFSSGIKIFSFLIFTDAPDPILHKVQNMELVVYPAANGRLGCVTQR